MTCGGAMTTFDLVLGLIASRHGEALRLEVARLFQPPSGSVQAILPFGRKRKPVVEKALSLMSGALETPLSIRDIVSRLNTTQRGLNRAFQADLGASAAQVYKRLRLAEVRRLAQHSHLSITEIALRCGYRNAASMTRAFVEEYGRPPSTYRTQD
jgi:transcriptional regulator GlxA family with amidase domain